MAIITCPECGKDVSDKTNTCIHCGCNLFYCQECGGVSSNEIKACPNCGFETLHTEEVSKTVAKAEEDESTVYDSIKVIRAWQNNDKSLNWWTIAHIFFFIMYFVPWGIWLLAAVFTMSVIEANPIDILLTFNSEVSRVVSLLIWGVVVKLIVMIAEELDDFIKPIMLSNWMRHNNINVRAILSKDLSLDYDRMSTVSIDRKADAIRQCLYATNLRSNHSAFVFEVVNCIIKYALKAAAYIFGLIFVCHNVRIVLENDFLFGMETFKIAMIENWWQAVAVGICVAGFYLWKQFGETRSSGYMASYVDMNLPDNRDIYYKMIKNPNLYTEKKKK